MRKVLIYGAATVVILTAVFVVFWQIGNSRTFQFFGELVPRIETTEKVIALTFDDGPTPGFTEEILAILAEEDIKATFFLIGGDLEKNPGEGKRIVSAGHEIGNHSYSHTRMVLSSPSFVRSEIERTDALIAAAGYDKPVHFRPPYGKKLFTLPFYLSQHNRKTITWDVEPESFSTIANDTSEITQHVLENTRPGSIILLHVLYDPERKSLNAVRPVIEGLKERGYRFVTVSELLSISPTL